MNKGDHKREILPNARLALMVSLLFLFTFFCLKFDDFSRLYESSQHDLRAYLACGHNIVQNRHIYKTHHQAIPEDPSLTNDVPQYLYPPLLGMLMIPFNKVPYDTFKHIWFFLNFFFILHGVFLAVSILPFSKLRLPAFFAVSGVMLGSDMFQWLLRTAQVDGFAIYLSVLGLHFFERKRWIPSALLICIASWIKVTPGIFFVYLILRGDIRFAIYAVSAGILLGLAQVAAVGDEFFYFFSHTIPEEMPANLPVPSMQSLWSLCKLLVHPMRGREIFDSPESFDNLLLSLKALVFISGQAVVLRARSGRDGLFCGFAACSAVSLLITDLSWMMRFSWNFVSVAALLYIMASVRNWIVSVIVSSVGLLTILLNCSFIWRALFGRLIEWKAIFLGGPSLHALISLVIITVFVLFDSRWAPSFVWITRPILRLLSLSKKRFKAPSPV